MFSVDKLPSLPPSTHHDQIDALRTSFHIRIYVLRVGFTGHEHISVLVAGPDRPIPKAAPKPSVGSDTASVESGQTSTSAKASQMSSGVGDLYSRLGAALQERG